MCSELENSGFRVAVDDCSVTKSAIASSLTGKTVHVHAKKRHYTHDEDGRTAPGVRGHGSVPLRHSRNFYGVGFDSKQDDYMKVIP